MEQENIKIWAKQHTEDEIIAALLITFRESTITEIFKSLSIGIRSIPINLIENFTTFDRALLEAMRQWIQCEIVCQLRTISEAIQYTANRYPNNIGNIKESLEELSYILQEPLGSNLMLAGLQQFKLGVGTGDYSRNGEVYSRVDMDYSYEKGFEAGYNKALAATSLNTTAFNDRDIDL